MAAVEKKSGEKRARRTRGSGGIFAEGDGVWRVDVEVARDAVTGRGRRVSRTIRGTRADAEMLAAKLRLADHQKRLVTGKTAARSVAAVMEQYLAAIEKGEIELAPTTVVTSRSAIRTMSKTELADGRVFGSIRLTKLTWREIEQLYAAMKLSGKGNDWIRRCATVLTQALEFGRKRGLLESNPAKDSQRPKSRKTKPYSPTSVDVRAVLVVAEDRDPEMADIARLLVSTGMRRGELLALLWSDVDAEGRELSVSSAVVDGGPGIGVVRKPTKTSDWRDVPLTDSAFRALERQRARAVAVYGEADQSGYVFPGDAGLGEPIRPDRLSKRWSMAKGESPITLTHLRHFAATTMLDAGESYRTVADLLGNSENTLRLHYDGRTDVGKRKAVSALELD